MMNGFSARHGEILQELLAESAGGILIKTDREGFLEDASQSIETLGLRLSEMLFKPHLADLAGSEHANEIRTLHERTMTGTATARRIEFRVASSEEADAWYSLSLRPAHDDAGELCGALGLLSSIAGRRSLEEELAASSITDASTGLANGRAFQAMLAHSIVGNASGVVAVFELDRFASLKLRFGPSMANEALWAFGRFLANFLPHDQILARLDGDRFAVLMLETSASDALALIGQAFETFAGFSVDSKRVEARLTASAGIAALAGSADQAMINAERALVVARALGGQRVELHQRPPSSDGLKTGT